MIKYNKLFGLLALRGYKKTDLYTLADISTSTLAKLSKGDNLTTDIICRICAALDVQPGDIMEYIPKDKQ